mgnify:CR=1 FL=1
MDMTATWENCYQYKSIKSKYFMISFENGVNKYNIVIVQSGIFLHI